MSQTDTVSEQVQNAQQTNQNDSNIMAALSYISFISIIMYVLKKDDDYVVFHAKQGMVIFAFSLVGTITVPLFGLGFLISMGCFVLLVIGAVKAYQGQRYKFPVIFDLAQKINF